MPEERARRLATEAVERAGGSLRIYRSPRHPFSMNPTKIFEVEGEAVEIRWGEISSPAIATVAGYVFEIDEDGLELLIRPTKPRQD
jgi:hypothetical protein